MATHAYKHEDLGDTVSVVGDSSDGIVTLNANGESVAFPADAVPSVVRLLTAGARFAVKVQKDVETTIKHRKPRAKSAAKK